MTMTETCFACGGNAQLVQAHRRVRHGRRSVRVLDEFMQCIQCGEEYYLPGQMEVSQASAARQLSTQQDALSPEEISRVRQSLRLTQATFERLLNVGSKTNIRWERGTVRPNAATDLLLRLVRDVPGVAQYLAARACIELPEHSDVSLGDIATTYVAHGDPATPPVWSVITSQQAIEAQPEHLLGQVSHVSVIEAAEAARLPPAMPPRSRRSIVRQHLSEMELEVQGSINDS